MITRGFLNPVAYRRVAEAVPILCVDGIIGYRGKFLLVKRRKPPFRNRWWVPGGRVYKGERLIQAFHRKMREEVGLRGLKPSLVGVFEIHHRDPELGIPGGRHVVSVVFEVDLTGGHSLTLDDQHSEWRWADRLPRDFRIKESYKNA